VKIAKRVSELVQQNTQITTSTDDAHAHEFSIDDEGNGVTTYTIAGEEHQHSIKNFKVASKHGHSHTIPKEKIDDDA
jgi:hypothetical protein